MPFKVCTLQHPGRAATLRMTSYIDTLLVVIGR